MMAANYRHIGGDENRLGRHYGPFPAFWPPATLADQSDRRSRASRDDDEIGQIEMDPDERVSGVIPREE